MAIKVNIPYGENSATVSGLYQWDYGQTLEIESVDLGSMIGEVHFACPSMSEAIVVPCNFTEGLGAVTIPNECLEQSSTISAWIYEIAGTQGRTRKVITIHITARTRPSVGHDIPAEISDKYTALITEVNGAVKDLKTGEVVVKKATTAETATSAKTAGNASTANYAVSAASANTATKALKDADGIALKDIVHSPVDGYELYDTEETSIKGGLVAFTMKRSENGDSDVRLLTEVGGLQYTTNYSSTFHDEVTGGKSPGIYPMRLVFTHKSMGSFNVKVQALVNGAWYDQSYAEYPVSIYYKHLIEYPVG